MRFWIKPPVDETARTLRIVRWTVAGFTTGAVLVGAASDMTFLGVVAMGVIVLSLQGALIAAIRLTIHAEGNL